MVAVDSNDTTYDNSKYYSSKNDKNIENTLCSEELLARQVGQKSLIDVSDAPSSKIQQLFE